MEDPTAHELRQQYLDIWWHQAMDNKGGGQKRDVRAVVPYPLTAAAHFSREDMFSKIGKWFSKELQAGDDAFDAAVYIKTDEPDELAELLADEGLRAAILDAVESTGYPLLIEGPMVHLDLISFSAEEELETCQRAVAGVARQLARIARGRGLQPDPAATPLPHMPDTLEHLERARFEKLYGEDRYWPRRFEVWDSTLDSLDPFAQACTLAAGSKRPLETFVLRRTELLDGSLAPLAELTTVQELVLDAVPAATVLPPLTWLEVLTDLRLLRCPLTDLSPVANLPSLTELWLEGTPVADLSPLIQVPHLQKLDLRGTRVTDIAPLAQIPELQMLWLQGLSLPPEQVRSLQQALPVLELDPY